jgi:hypothetical protein
MVDRNDPGRAGVKAGRVVGVLTAALAVASLLSVQGSFYENVGLLFELAGIEADLSVRALFWSNVAAAAVARYTIGYVVGSLVGVAHGWLDEPSLAGVVAMVFVVGVVDGALAGLDTGSVVFAAAYLAAWLCYVPLFSRLYDYDAGGRSGPVRLGESRE